MLKEKLTYHGGMAKKKNIQRKRQADEQRRPFSFEESYDVVIVGAGAAGLACAVSCVQSAQQRGIKVPHILIVDQAKRVGTSILRSGNGRCNFSNSQLEVARYWNSGFVSEVLGNLEGGPVVPVLEWLEGLGLVWEEAPHTGGLLYPFSNKASSVLEVLTAAPPAEAAEVHPCVQARAVERLGGGAFQVHLEEVVSASAAGKGAAGGSPKQATVRARRVVLAAGGGFSRSLKIMPDASLLALQGWRPTLGPLQVSFPEKVNAEDLDGIRVQARVCLPESGFSETGEVLFRSYGISGIVVFNASRYAQPGSALQLDLLPQASEGKARELLQQRIARVGDAPARQLFCGFLLSELGNAVLAAAGLRADAPLGPQDCPKLVQALKAFPLQVHGIADEKQCQVHRGGISPSAVNPETLELKACPGLYALGEALDVDGPCGGYNLHWAWACGIVAGRSLARTFGKDCS